MLKQLEPPLSEVPSPADLLEDAVRHVVNEAREVPDALPVEQASVRVKGIAILGSHPVTVMQAPFEDDWLIYACSPHNFEMRQLPRFDQWFENHVPLADKTRAYPYLRWLETVPIVWMRDPQAMHLFPGAHRYPELEMFGRLVTKPGKCPDGFFRSQITTQQMGKFSFFAKTSSIALMMAKAITDCEKHGIPEIGLWGIMQQSETEYAYQRPGIQYFIDQAIRRGIKVRAPDCSMLFEPMREVW